MQFKRWAILIYLKNMYGIMISFLYKMCFNYLYAILDVSYCD